LAYHQTIVYAVFSARTLSTSNEWSRTCERITGWYSVVWRVLIRRIILQIIPTIRIIRILSISTTPTMEHPIAPIINQTAAPELSLHQKTQPRINQCEEYPSRVVQCLRSTCVRTHSGIITIIPSAVTYLFSMIVAPCWNCICSYSSITLIVRILSSLRPFGSAAI